MAESVQIGDRICFSVGLLKQISEEELEHVAVVVELIAIRDQEDGSKVLVLQRVDRDELVEIRDQDGTTIPVFRRVER